jgi:hypothetical protein
MTEGRVAVIYRSSCLAQDEDISDMSEEYARP